MNASHRDASPTFERERRGAAVAAGLCLLAAVLMVGGCQSAYNRVSAESQVEEFARLGAAADRVPVRTVHPDTGHARGAVKLAVHESGQGDRDQAIVLLHGVMSDSRMWRYVIGGLAAQHDLIAIDLPGCGGSDHLPMADIGSDGYGPASLARSVLLALRQRIAARRAPVGLTLVGHSLGGTVILRMFANPGLRSEFADVLSHVERLVLFAPVDVFVDINQPMFREVVELSDRQVAIGRALGLVRERVSAGTLTSVSDSTRALRDEADRVTEVLLDGPRRHAAQAMLRQAVPLDGSGRLDVLRADQIAAGYAYVRPPCLIVWGQSDNLLPQSMGYKLACEIPNARLRIVTDARHCLPTERPATCIGLIDDFMAATDGAVPKVATINGMSGKPIVLVDISGSSCPRARTACTWDDKLSFFNIPRLIACWLTSDTILRWSR